jgi:hypothetical protein
MGLSATCGFGSGFFFMRIQLSLSMIGKTNSCGKARGRGAKRPVGLGN